MNVELKKIYYFLLDKRYECYQGDFGEDNWIVFWLDKLKESVE